MYKYLAKIVIVAPFAFFGMNANAHDAHKKVKEIKKDVIVEFAAKTKEERSKIANLGYAIDQVMSDKVFITVSKEEAKKIQEKGFDVKLRDYQPRFDKFVEFGPGMVKHSYADVVRELQELSTNHAQIMSLDSLGTSVEGRDVPVLRISGMSRAAAQEAELPVVLYTGCHHAREHLSVEIPLLFAKYLADEYSKGNPTVKRLIDTRELYISPIINPDGHVYDFTGPTTRGRMWRKNRRQNANGTYGVDLNRNYGYQWGTGGSSNNPRSDVYMGPTPFSEPETQNVKRFVDSQPRMTNLISFHTFSELVLYPWGHSYDSVGEKLGNAADLPVFEKMAQDMSRWNNYRPQQSSDLYIASGDTTDWAYGEHGIFAFTFELSPRSLWEGGFYPGVEAIQPTFEENINPMLYLLEYADDPTRVLREEIPDFHHSPSEMGVPVASFGDLDLN